MAKVRVLIVDDSVVFRTQVKTALETVPWIEVVGVAANGKIALDKISCGSVDLVILDLEMPVMTGLETLSELKKLPLKPKVIVFSSQSKRGAQITMDALALGATDFVAKPNGQEFPLSNDPAISLRELLLPKIEQLFQPKPIELKQIRPPKNNFSWETFQPEAIVIGCSTGGPTVLEKIFSGLKGPFSCPVFIVQHMPPIFTTNLADRISKLTGVPAAEGIHGETVSTNRIYVAPGNFHMQVARLGGQLTIQLNQEAQECSVRPAVDQLFRSAANVFRNNCLGFILTGMGKDGLAGTQLLRQNANPVIIQSKDSCVVFGMPGALYEAGEYDSIKDIDEITATLKAYLGRSGETNRVPA